MINIWLRGQKNILIIKSKYYLTEFSGCAKYMFNPKTEKIDSEIFYLMKEKKYEEVIALIVIKQ